MVADLKAALGKVKAKLHRLRNAAHRNRAKIAWFVKRKTILRKKLKEAKARRPHFEPWMTNGHSQNITDAVKHEIAIGVTRYDLYVTSTSDGVPGDGRHTSTSLHYPQNNSDGEGHAADIAGARMAEFQRARFHVEARFQELFGPDNAAWVKNGYPTSGIEGTALENLHDTHVHDAPYA